MIKQWQKIVAKVARQLYDNQLKGDISPEMVTAHANYLFEAVDTSVPKSIAAKDTAMMFNMRRNVFHFSGAKNWQQLQEMSRLIKDAQGNPIPFNEFLKDIKAIDKTYNATYLKAEYGLATRTAKNAAKWSRFQGEKDIFPNLRYEAVGDARTRPEHAALDGIVKPIDHPFWKRYYPPNGWNCRCSVQQEDSDTPVTPDADTPIPDNVPPVMQGNAGIDGVIFNKKHPYFDTIPKRILNSIEEKSTELMFQSMPEKDIPVTRIFEHSTNGYIDRQESYDKKDYTENLVFAKIFAKNDYSIVIRRHSQATKIKNPEVYINGILSDFKKLEVKTDSAVQGAVKRANKQKAEAVAIYINPLLKFDVETIANGLFSSIGMKKNHKNKMVQTFFLFDNNQVVPFSRNDILKQKYYGKLRHFLKHKEVK